MKIYDISQEVFGCVVFPGDPAPERQILSELEKGGSCNLTAIRMCAHNGTHVDAPYHFCADGKTIDEVGLEVWIGPCYVAEHEGVVTAEDTDPDGFYDAVDSDEIFTDLGPDGGDNGEDAGSDDGEGGEDNE